VQQLQLPLARQYSLNFHGQAADMTADNFLQCVQAHRIHNNETPSFFQSSVCYSPEASNLVSELAPYHASIPQAEQLWTAKLLTTCQNVASVCLRHRPKSTSYHVHVCLDDYVSPLQTHVSLSKRPLATPQSVELQTELRQVSFLFRSRTFNEKSGSFRAPIK